MLAPRREQVTSAASINATTTYGPFQNRSRFMNPVLVVDAFSTGATGTSPTCTITVEVVDDAGHVYTLSGNIALTNSTLSGRQVFTPVIEGQYKIVATIGGSASPTFNGVDINVYMTAPDA